MLNGQRYSFTERTDSLGRSVIMPYLPLILALGDCSVEVTALLDTGASVNVLPTAPGFATTRSLTQIIAYDAFNMAEDFLTQPLQIVAGSLAGSKWMSDDLYNRAASKNKKFHIVEGSNHMKLYDVPQYVDEAVSVLAPFFKENLEEVQDSKKAAS